MKQPLTFDSLKYPLFVAHRGYSAKYPENTLASFSAAVEQGAQMIELDVTLSKDREIVVLHDDTVDRTTNGSGVVQDYLLPALRQLDAGTWFNPRFRNEKIPTLQEVLNRVQGRTRINIEIKSSAFEQHRPSDSIEKQVCELLQKCNATNGVLISSMDDRIVENVRELDSHVRVALIALEPLDAKTIEQMVRLRAFSWHPDEQLLTKEQVDRVHEAGIRVFPFTINTREALVRMMELNVDGVFTDDPVFLVSALP